MDRGFDEFFGFLNEGHFYVPPPYEGVTSFLRRKVLPPGAVARWTEGNIVWSSEAGGDEPPYDADNPLLRGRQIVTEQEYLTDALTREAIRFIDRHQREPFFLYLAYNAVHSPMQCAKAYLERFSHIEDIHRRVFAAMLANLDDGVGQVLDKNPRGRIERRTLVFLLSDNGGPTKELTSSNAPLRGGKGDMYEGGIRLPFIISWPGVVPAGKVGARPISAVDILPTALAAAGRAVPRDRVIDGVNLVPFLRGEASGQPHESLYWRMGDKAAWRQGDWKLVIHRPGTRPSVESSCSTWPTIWAKPRILPSAARKRPPNFCRPGSGSTAIWSRRVGCPAADGALCEPLPVSGRLFQIAANLSGQLQRLDVPLGHE